MKWHKQANNWIIQWYCRRWRGGCRKLIYKPLEELRAITTTSKVLRKISLYDHGLHGHDDDEDDEEEEDGDSDDEEDEDDDYDHGNLDGDDNDEEEDDEDDDHHHDHDDHDD